MTVVLVIAPHPDDETLGCGGTLLKHRAAGDEIHWLIVTCAHEWQSFPADLRIKRIQEIQNVQASYGFAGVHELKFPAAELDRQPKGELVAAMAKVMHSVQPNVLYIPYRNDVHSDHEVTFDVAAACSKSFRYPSIRAIRVYETLSETEFGIRPEDAGFRPNFFVDVAEHIEKKLEIMRIYTSEVQAHPGPRSFESIRALATVRGVVIGSEAAEAFMSLREIM